MAKENDPEMFFDVENILVSFIKAMSSASLELQKFTKEQKQPYIYHIPKMSISLKVALTYSKGKIKGVFFKKSKSSVTEELLSNITLDVVSLPRQVEKDSEE